MIVTLDLNANFNHKIIKRYRMGFTNTEGPCPIIEQVRILKSFLGPSIPIRSSVVNSQCLAEANLTTFS